jgi:hypothetical protein
MPPLPAIARWLAPLFMTLVAASGCSLVGSALVSRDSLPDETLAESSRPKPAPRTIQLEVLFVRHADDDRLFRETLWTHVDEQVLDLEQRRSLNANGLRAGIVSGELPPELGERLAAATVHASPGDVAAVDAVRSRRRLQLLPGRRSELVTATRLPQLVLLEQCGGEIRGGTYHDATPLLAVEAEPAADGRVRLTVVPEIKHGPVEKTWEGEDGMFRLEAGQRRHRLDHLGIDVTVPAGGTLFVGCAGDPSATVADGLLRDADGGESHSTKLVAIRAVARSLDPAFAAAEASADPTAE